MTLLCVVSGYPVTISPAAAQQDAPVVYCLTQGKPDALVKAAVALRLATPASSPDRVKVGDQEWDVTKWRDQRNDDFSRACEALYTVEQQRPAPAPSAPSFLTTIIPILSALVGAFATLLLTTWRDKVTRGKLQAEALTTTAGEFLLASESYLAGWTGVGSPPEAADVRAARMKMLDKLAPIDALHPAWTVVPKLRELLMSGPLGPPMTEDWARRDNEGRAVRIGDLKLQLDELYNTIVQVAHSLGRPIRSFRGNAALRAGTIP